MENKQKGKLTIWDLIPYGVILACVVYLISKLLLNKSTGGKTNG